MASLSVPKQSDEAGWGRLAPILAVHFLGTLGFSLAIPFLVFIVRDLGGAAWTYGWVGATYSAFQLFGAPTLGRWSDRWGRRPVLVMSQVGTLVAWLLFLVALSTPAGSGPELWGATLTLPLLLVFVARALDGATGGNISVANAYVADITQHTPELRQRAFGRMGMAASLGFVLGPAMAGLLGGTSWGPRLPIAVAACIAGLTTIAVWALLREPTRPCPQGPPARTSLQATLHQQTRPCRAMKTTGSLSVLADPLVVRMTVGTFLLFLGFNFFYSAFPIHAAQVYAWTPHKLGIFFALMSGVMVVTQGPILSLVSRRFSPRSVFATGVFFLAVALLVFPQPGTTLPFVGAACFALGNGLAWPTFQARVAEVAGDAQGAIQGMTTAAGSLASILGLILGAGMYPVLGGTTFEVAAGVFVLVLFLAPVWFGRKWS